jgi:hypothetical protein
MGAAFAAVARGGTAEYAGLDLPRALHNARFRRGFSLARDLLKPWRR